MIIGGFQPFSLSDYPGHMAAIVFTQGCNFKCPFCHNSDLIPSRTLPGKQVPEAVVMEHLIKRQGKLDGLVVTGGEPTLQPALPDFLRRVKALGYKVKLDTNGSRPGVIARLLEEELVDCIAMDVKAPLEAYERLAGVRVATRDLEESIAMISWSKLPHIFRTTLVRPLLSTGDIRAIHALIPKDSPHRLQGFREEHCFDPSLRGAPARKDPEKVAAGVA